MHKKIIFSLLLIANTITHGMEIQEPTISLETVLRNSDIAWRVTKHLCINHRCSTRNLKNDIRALYETNKFFHDYYDQEKVKQNIITTCEPIYYSGQYRTVTEVLCCHTITKKMDYFCNIANNKEIQFTEDDLKDPWYFSINLSKYNEQSLLYMLIKNLQFEKAHTFITHAEKIDFGRHVNNYLLKLISESRHSITDEKIREELLCITERLLREKNMPADVNSSCLQLTALMDAAQNNDQSFARLLLQFGANPSKRRGNYSFEKNSFEMEKGEPKGWLKHMVIMNKTEKEGAVLKYWLLKNYINSDEAALLQELRSLILNDFLKITLSQIFLTLEREKSQIKNTL